MEATTGGKATPPLPSDSTENILKSERTIDIVLAANKNNLRNGSFPDQRRCSLEEFVKGRKVTGQSQRKVTEGDAGRSHALARLFSSGFLCDGTQ